MFFLESPLSNRLEDALERLDPPPEAKAPRLVSSTIRDHIGPYRLIKMIQLGNATQVWEAINSTDNRRVALKILREDRLHDRAELAGMRHEFDVGSQFSHPNIVRVMEMSWFKKIPYLIIEFFNAPNLKQCLRNQPEHLEKHLHGAIRQAVAGLQHVHEKGWVHRDVKPENLLLGEDGMLKVIDFAIAQRVRRGLGKLFGGKAPVQGTRSYIAPEQIRYGAVDPRADIYSLGCTIFHLVAGRVPYTGTSADDLLVRHLKGSVPSVASENSKVTPEFNELVLSMMAKSPEQRPQTLAVVAEALRKIKLFKGDRQSIEVTTHASADVS